MASGKSEEKAEIRKIRTERRCYIKSHVPTHFLDGEHDFFHTYRNCSVPSQSRAKIHEKLPEAMGFLPTRLCFLTVSAVNAQTY